MSTEIIGVIATAGATFIAVITSTIIIFNINAIIGIIVKDSVNDYRIGKIVYMYSASLVRGFIICNDATRNSG